jgi:hypothetical protein
MKLYQILSFRAKRRPVNMLILMITTEQRIGKAIRGSYVQSHSRHAMLKHHEAGCDGGR